MKSLWALLLLYCVSAGAQLTPKTIVFTGAPQYTQADLLTMSGLTAGKLLTKDDIEIAMHKLDDSGLFAGINYKAANGVLTFELEPMAESKARPVHYANFVMATPDELDAAIHARLPGYTGTIPVVGDMQQKVERTLEAILKERGIDAHVEAIGSNGNHVLDYNITSPPVVVGKLVVTDVDFTKSETLVDIRKRFEGQDYLEGLTNEALRTNLVDAYQDLGFLDFAVGKVEHGKPVVTPQRIAVDLTGAAQDGAYYTVAKVDLPAPVAGVEARAIQAQVDLKVGGPASRILRLATEAKVKNAYYAHGYLDVATTTSADKDAVKHTVTYAFPTVPGERYAFRSFSTTGFTPALDATLQHAFKLAPGSPLELSALSAFQTSPEVKTVCHGQPPEIGIRPDRATHQVDLVAACKAGR